MRISDWSSDVCSSDLRPGRSATAAGSVNCGNAFPIMRDSIVVSDGLMMPNATTMMNSAKRPSGNQKTQCFMHKRSEEHTSELQSLMRISYAVFCLKKKKQKITNMTTVPKQTYSVRQQKV